MNIYQISLVLMSIMLAGCQATEQDDLSVETQPVVQAFLTPGVSPEVKVSRVIAFSDDSTSSVAEEISGLEIQLTDGNNVCLLVELSDSLAGTYTDTSGCLVITPGSTYQLSFYYNECLITSATTVPSKPLSFECSETQIKVERITEDTEPGPPSMTEVELTWVNDELDYYLISIRYMEEEYDTINLLEEIEDAYDIANFSTEPMQVNFYTIRSMQFAFFGQYQIVLSHVNSDYANLYESLGQSTLDGLVEPTPNIENAKGIFTSYNSDTLYLNVLEQ